MEDSENAESENKRSQSGQNKQLALIKKNISAQHIYFENYLKDIENRQNKNFTVKEHAFEFERINNSYFGLVRNGEDRLMIHDKADQSTKDRNH